MTDMLIEKTHGRNDDAAGVACPGGEIAV